MMDDALEVTLVFKALTRRSVILGVDYDYFFISIMVVMLAFVASSQLLMMLLMIPLHIIGMILCQIDPYIFKLLSTRASLGYVKNHKFWGLKSYAPY